MTPILGIWASSAPAAPAARGLFGGGLDTSGNQLNSIEYVQIATTGNATDFGDLQANTQLLAACASSTRGIFGGGEAPGGLTNRIDYITISTTGNASDFGDLTVARSDLAGLSNSTRGLFVGGGASGYSNVIDYITIATTGNATDFGDMIYAAVYYGGCSSTTRGVIAGSAVFFTPGPYNDIQYVTIATTGNATDFGDLQSARWSIAVGNVSSGTRGVFAGGNTGNPFVPPNTVGYSNIIEYVTIATTGNSTDFGDLSNNDAQLSSCSSTLRGLFGGGTNGTSALNVIDYITIATTGNATDFGDLITARRTPAGCSNSHGGI